jgi:hypothetical protein
LGQSIIGAEVCLGPHFEMNSYFFLNASKPDEQKQVHIGFSIFYFFGEGHSDWIWRFARKNFKNEKVNFFNK